MCWAARRRPHPLQALASPFECPCHPPPTTDRRACPSCDSRRPVSWSSGQRNLWSCLRPFSHQIYASEPQVNAIGCVCWTRRVTREVTASALRGQKGEGWDEKSRTTCLAIGRGPTEPTRLDGT